MANHCYNDILITMSNTKDVEKITSWLNDYDKFDYMCDWVNSIIDEEHRLTKDYKDGGDPRAYGGRWFDFTTAFVDETTISVIGDSAWSPMEGLCEVISKQFNCFVTIAYEESGCDFGGETSYNSGEKNIIFSGTYIEYMYYLNGIEAVYNECGHIENLIELEDYTTDWLVIIKEPEDKAKLLEWYNEMKSVLSKTTA